MTALTKPATAATTYTPPVDLQSTRQENYFFTSIPDRTNGDISRHFVREFNVEIIKRSAYSGLFRLKLYPVPPE